MTTFDTDSTDIFGGMDGGMGTNETSIASSQRQPASLVSNKISTTDAKKALKIPSWVWIIVTIVAIAVVTVAILIPLVFLKKSTPGTPTPIDPTSSKQPFIPTFNTISSKALVFQLAVPALDGISKAGISITDTNVTNTNINQIGFVLIGNVSKTAFYVTSFNPPAISNPQTVNTSNTITNWASTNGTDIYLANPNFYNCTSNIQNDTTSCQATTWPNTSNIDTTLFNVTTWTAVTQPVMISFAFNQTYQVTLQTTVADLNLNQVFTGLQSPLNASVKSLNTTYNQKYLTIGVAQNFTNYFEYLTYFDTIIVPETHTLKLDGSDEALRYSSMTFDGQWLLLLSNERLALYHRPSVTVTQATFELVDSVFFSIKSQTMVCAVDQQAPAGVTEIWCAVGFQNNYTLILPFDTSTKKFLTDQGRQVPCVHTNSSNGPMNLRFLTPITNNNLFLLTSDEFGNYENTLIDTSKL